MPKNLRIARTLDNLSPFNWVAGVRLILLGLLTKILSVLLQAEAPMRIWTSSDGRTLEAKFVEKVDENRIKIQTRNNQEFTLEKSMISAADWKYVQREMFVRQAKQVEEKKDALFKLPMSLSAKGSAIITSIQGNIEIFENPINEGSFQGGMIDGKYVGPRKPKGRKPKVGDSIDMGAVILTGINSEAVLLLTNGSIATLGESSRLVLDSLWQTPFGPSNKKVSELNEEPSQSRTAMNLDFGDLIVQVKKLNKESSFLVYSHLGQAGIRGTELRFTSEKNATSLSVLDGLVNYKALNRRNYSVRKEQKVTTQTFKSSNREQLNQIEKSRIVEAISKASKTASSYDLRKLSDASLNASQQKKTFIAKSAKDLEMVWCPPGSFFKKPSYSDSFSGLPSTVPNGQVVLTRGFFLGKYEVTQDQYQSVTKADRFFPDSNEFPFFKGPRLPVEMISWDAAKKFCNKLNRLEKARIPVGWRFTLPSEIQWEYACRAGTTTNYSFGDSINPTLANYKDSGLEKTVQVGSYQSNPWGLYDMHGNLWEWIDGSLNQWRIIRGGAWNEVQQYVRSDSRGGYYGFGKAHIGFRLCLEPVPQNDSK